MSVPVYTELASKTLANDSNSLELQFNGISPALTADSYSFLHVVEFSAAGEITAATGLIPMQDVVFGADKMTHVPGDLAKGGHTFMKPMGGAVVTFCGVTHEGVGFIFPPGTYKLYGVSSRPGSIHTLANLPVATTLPAGTQAQVEYGNPPNFMATMQVVGTGTHRKWLCVAGSTDDLVNQNIDFSAVNTWMAPTGTPKWDFRFPYQLVSIGAVNNLGYFTYSAWTRMDSKTISMLTAGGSGNLAGTGQFVELRVPKGEDVNVQQTQRVYKLGRTGTDQILLAADDAGDDLYPLRIRGSA